MLHAFEDFLILLLKIIAAYSLVAGTILGLVVAGVAISSPRYRKDFHANIQRCVVGNQCPEAGDWAHVFAEKIAWKIMDPSKPNWRVVPAVATEAIILVLLLFPKQVHLEYLDWRHPKRGLPLR